MRSYVEERVRKVADYMAKNKTTIRETAKVFHVSKATVYVDIEERLPQLNYQLYDRVRKVVEVNKSERYLRGGLATKKLYESLGL